MALSKTQIKHLKALAHNLKPIIMLGQNGYTDAVQKEIDIALNFHELIKVKLASNDRDARSQTASDIASSCEAETIQIIGKTLILFRRNHKKPVIELPK